MTGQQPPVPLTAFWKLMITFAAMAGVGTCAVLGLVYVRFVMGVPGTVHVLAGGFRGRPAITRAEQPATVQSSHAAPLPVPCVPEKQAKDQHGSS